MQNKMKTSMVSPVVVQDDNNKNDKKGHVDPTANDVKCGRGARNFQHPGNRYLRQVIEPEVANYHKCCTRTEKTVIITAIIAAIFKRGGRFLKLNREDFKWYDGGLKAAKLRVGVAFRDAVARKKRVSNETNSSTESGKVLHGSAESEEKEHCHDTTTTCEQQQQQQQQPLQSKSSHQPLIPDYIASSYCISRPWHQGTSSSILELLAAAPWTSQQPQTLCSQTMKQQLPLTSKIMGDIFEPQPIDSDHGDLGMATAQSVLEALSYDDDDDASLFSLTDFTDEHFEDHLSNIHSVPDEMISQNECTPLHALESHTVSGRVSSACY